MRVDESTFKAMVARHFPAARLAEFTRLIGGVSADVFKLVLEDAGKEMNVVIRVHGDTHSGHPASREFELLKSLHNAEVLVARPILVDVSRQDIAADYLMMDFVEGSTAVESDFVHDALRKMAEALFGLHDNFPKGLPKLSRRREPLPELFNYLPEGDEWQAMSQFLATVESQFEGNDALLHGDFWPENVMWKDKQVVAILDWEDGATGDPLSDVACCFVELRYIYGLTGSEIFLREYTRLAGSLDQKRFSLWKIYVSAAAQKYMSLWRLPPEKEAHMRAIALPTTREAAAELMQQA